MVIFYSYVSLPEGIWQHIYGDDWGMVLSWHCGKTHRFDSTWCFFVRRCMIRLESRYCRHVAWYYAGRCPFWLICWSIEDWTSKKYTLPETDAWHLESLFLGWFTYKVTKWSLIWEIIQNSIESSSDFLKLHILYNLLCINMCMEIGRMIGKTVEDI